MREVRYNADTDTLATLDTDAGVVILDTSSPTLREARTVRTAHRSTAQGMPVGGSMQ